MYVTRLQGRDLNNKWPFVYKQGWEDQLVIELAFSENFPYI